MASRKGKEVAKGKGSSGKRKHDDGKDDKAGKGRKRSNPDVRQFIDDAACVVDDDEVYDDLSDMFNDDISEDDFDPEIHTNNVLPARTTQLPFALKEEELSGDELVKFMEERYKPGSGFVNYEENVYDSNRPIDGSTSLPSQREPTIWKVKCMIGRERHSVFCLMQKFMDLQPLGTKLQIISAFALDHVKGFIYVEAERQHDVHEACKGLCTMYWTRVAPVPKSEVAHLLSVRSRVSEIPVGSWARVKNGKYKGDLAEVIHVNESRKKATVKLIPRIDLQSMSEKFGGGAPSKKEVPVPGTTTRKTIIPAPRLISPIELEEFLPFMQQRRDRDTGLFCYFLNGMMLKDGYLYKKVPVDSLSFSGVMPTEAELLKFESPQQEDSNDKEWLFELYGEQPKKAPTKRHDKGGGGKGEVSGSKGEASSSSSMISTFEVHDLVFFGRNDFGVVVGTSKDDSIKILKDGSEGPIVVTHDASQLKSGSFDRKFTALDNRKKILLVNDTVRVVDGSLQGRQGIVKLIYRGIVYICDENELENSGYICCKSHLCEKLKISSGKGEETEVSAFDDCPASPKTPLPTDRPWEQGENNKFNRGDNEAMFTIGQSLRIKVGPLKGYLCRVLALRRSDVTVKLDSQHKILTVKCEHLTEVRGKGGAYSSSDNAEIAKPFDLLGTQNDSGDWMAGVGTSADGERWGAGGITTERSSWPAFGSSSLSSDPASTSTNSQIKDAGDSSWDTKVVPAIASSWNMTASDEKIVGSSEQSGGWGKSENVVTSKIENEWNKAKDANNGPSKDAESSWGRSDAFLDKGKGILGNPGSSWGNTSAVGKNNTNTWGKESGSGGGTSSWGKSLDTGNKSTAEETSDGGAWAKPVKKDGGSAWNSSVASEPGNNAAAEEGNWKKSSTTVGGQAVQWGSTVKTDGGGASWGNSGSSIATNNKPSDVSWGKEDAKDGASNDSKSPWGSSNSAPERQTGGWSNKSSDGGTQWGQSSKCSTDVSKDQQSGWGHSQSSGNNSQGKASCWNQSTTGGSVEDLKGTTDQGGDDWINKQKAGGSQESSWGKKASSDSNKQDSGWGNKRSWDSGNQDSGWGNKRSCDSGNQDSGWATKKSWDSGNSFGGNENQSAEMDGDGGQRGGRRGGYRGGRGVRQRRI